MVEYLIIGSGIGAASMIKPLLENGISFKVVADGSQQSSVVAGALYNPVILKRFTAVWKAAEQLADLEATFRFYETYFGRQFIVEVPVLRKLASIEEQNYWFEAADKPALSPFLKTSLVKNVYTAINAPFGFGEVAGTGRVEIGVLLDLLKTGLVKEGMFLEETFEHLLLKQTAEGYAYKNITAKRVVFCEGYGLLENPYFKYLPLRGTKGQLLLMKAPELKVDAVIKSAAFIIPIGDDIYKVGATYEHTDKNNEPTEEGKQELLEKIKPLVRCNFEIIGQLAGVRPTVADRRPLIGEHPVYKNMYVLNGLGTRGIMIGPYVANQLYRHIHFKEDMVPEADIKRFEKRWYKQIRA